jgi:nitrate reductase gamma subunit
VNPSPITPAHTVKAVDDGGIDWMPITFGLVGGLLAVGAVALLSIRRRRTHGVRLAS